MQQCALRQNCATVIDVVVAKQLPALCSREAAKKKDSYQPNHTAIFVRVRLCVCVSVYIFLIDKNKMFTLNLLAMDSQ